MAQNRTAMEPKNIAEFTRRHSVSAIVWGYISYYGVSELVILDGTV